ncbi:hypothetical protein TWF506_000917 [Arthrobotrys conoides]|uniref:Uncharacterized protein n=1 Tax=Arthrobotrys conoides TaxID=74498 RepID=A0AAN8S1B6_9PEZI
MEAIIALLLRTIHMKICCHRRSFPVLEIATRNTGELCVVDVASGNTPVEWNNWANPEPSPASLAMPWTLNPQTLWGFIVHRSMQIFLSTKVARERLVSRLCKRQVMGS